MEEELMRVRRELAALRGARQGALWRNLSGFAPEADLLSAYRRFPAPAHADAWKLVRDAAAAEKLEELQVRLRRLLEAVAQERERVTCVGADEKILGWEATAVVDGPEGRRALREARTLLRSERRRGMRAALADAIARKEEELTGLRSDRLALARERIGRLGGTDPVAFRSELAGFDLRALAEEGRAVLAQTEDAWRELLGWASSRYLQASELEAHDLTYLRAAPFTGGVFPSGGLTLVLLGTIDRLGLRRAGIELDLERRPNHIPGARVFPREIPGRIAVSLAPGGQPDDWRELLGALGRAAMLVSIPKGLPVEDAWCGDLSLDEAWGLAFEGLLQDRLFYKRVLSAPSARGEEAARAFTLGALAELRRSVGLLLFELELWGRGASRVVASAYAELMHQATGARHDERLFLAEASPELEIARRVRGMSLVPAIERHLLERFDEDWWRNPRCGPHLQGLFARGRAVDPAALARELGGELSLSAYAASLVSRLG